MLFCAWMHVKGRGSTYLCHAWTWRPRVILKWCSSKAILFLTPFHWDLEPINFSRLSRRDTTRILYLPALGLLQQDLCGGYRDHTQGIHASMATALMLELPFYPPNPNLLNKVHYPLSLKVLQYDLPHSLFYFVLKAPETHRDWLSSFLQICMTILGWWQKLQNNPTLVQNYI